MSARPTACAATSLMNTSAGRRARRSACNAPRTRTAADPRFCSQPCGAGPPLGQRIILNTLSRETPTMRETIQPLSLRSDGKVFACGRDPYFPAWPDVLQLNAFQPGLRQAVIETVSDIAEQCDGIRCDMAMLMLNNIFERTWGARAGAKPADDYWATVIPAIKAKSPSSGSSPRPTGTSSGNCNSRVLISATTRNSMTGWNTATPRACVSTFLADSSYQEKMVRFIENHDEPRAAATFPDGKGRAAAVAILTLTGARLLHEGQFEGRKVRLPVFLRPSSGRAGGSGPLGLLCAPAESDRS